MRRIFLFLIFVICFISCFILTKRFIKKEKMPLNSVDAKIETPVTIKKDITISAVGDCTIGSDPNFSYSNSFLEVYDKNNPELIKKADEKYPLPKKLDFRMHD